MADYRDWCGSCGNEINFGSHDRDCDYLHAERIARKELQDFESALREEYRDKSDDEVFAETVAVHEEIRALSARMLGLDKKWNFLRYEVLMNRNLIDKFREATGRRYV